MDGDAAETEADVDVANSHDSSSSIAAAMRCSIVVVCGAPEGALRMRRGDKMQRGGVVLKGAFSLFVLAEVGWLLLESDRS